MKNLLRSLIACATLPLVAACGHGPVGVALQQKAHLPTAMVAGEERAFGYDLDRYSHLQHPVKGTDGIDWGKDLPPAVDNRQYCSKVADQGKLGACTAFALGKGLREYLLHKNFGNNTPLSAMWLYYNERVHMGPQYVSQDSGSTLLDGTWVLSHQGIATQATCPYEIPKFAVAPSDQANATAMTFKIRAPLALFGMNDVKGALASGQPVAFAFRAYESLKTVGADGLMPMPKPNERLLGGHAVLAVGYDDARQVVICRNSWGERFGDKGYFYMPYAFLQASNNTMDFWTVIS